MTTYTLYDARTGALLGHVRCAPENLKRNVRSGQAAYAGELDLYSQRIDVATGEPVDAPDIAAARAQGQRRDAALTRIEELERRMLRRVREILAKDDQMLRELDQEVAALRAELQPPPPQP